MSKTYAEKLLEQDEISGQMARRASDFHKDPDAKVTKTGLGSDGTPSGNIFAQNPWYGSIYEGLAGSKGTTGVSAAPPQSYSNPLAQGISDLADKVVAGGGYWDDEFVSSSKSSVSEEVCAKRKLLGECETCGTKLPMTAFGLGECKCGN